MSLLLLFDLLPLTMNAGGGFFFRLVATVLIIMTSPVRGVSGLTCIIICVSFVLSHNTMCFIFILFIFLIHCVVGSLYKRWAKEGEI